MMKSREIRSNNARVDVSTRSEKFFIGSRYGKRDNRLVESTLSDSEDAGRQLTRGWYRTDLSTCNLLPMHVFSEKEI